MSFANIINLYMKKEKTNMIWSHIGESRELFSKISTSIEMPLMNADYI